jgi:hypothetical protein
VANASAVDRLAREHDRAAGEIVEIGRRSMAVLERAAFEGPAAGRLRDSAYGRLQVLQRNADELRWVARVLRQHAEWIREQERRNAG